MTQPACHPEYAAIFDLPWGRVGVQATPDTLIAVSFLASDQPLQAPANPLAAAAKAQLSAYGCDPGTVFDLPLAAPATFFQARVRTALLNLPVGTTLSYGRLAQYLGTAPRAVAAACRRNPLPLIVPCHRVVAAHSLGGYAGHLAPPWTTLKTALLEHEDACPSLN